MQYCVETPISLQFHLFKLTVYLGKRDFVDHVDIVEPVGMPFILFVFVFILSFVFNVLLNVEKLTY